MMSGGTDAMNKFEDGVKGYITGTYAIKISFPINWNDVPDVCCYQCKMFSRSTGICQLTKEVSEYPTKYISSHCPLEFTGEAEIKEEL